MPRSPADTLAAGQARTVELEARAARWRERRRRAFRLHLAGLSLVTMAVLAAIAFAMQAGPWLALLAPLPAAATLTVLRWRGGGLVLGMTVHGAACGMLVFVFPMMAQGSFAGGAGSLLVFLFGLAACPLLGGVAGWLWERLDHDTIQI
jgi:hypothetical protein